MSCEGTISAVTLFASDPQYREKATIWRVFSMLPLYGNLAGGRVFRWFAVNIPMDLGTGGSFTSDIDIVARLHDYPRSKEWIYKTWEVKVSLLCKDGSARSLKQGKTRRLLTQLNAYRKYGAPDVSLLDIFICEAGFMDHNAFPPPVLHNGIRAKLEELRRNRFGYQLLPFEHGQDADGDDIGLRSFFKISNPLQTTFNLAASDVTGPEQPFSRLMERLDTFFENCGERPHKHFSQIVFCKECHQLQLIRMQDEERCPTCKSDLIIQS
jgi:hypothetical protein